MIWIYHTLNIDVPLYSKECNDMNRIKDVIKEKGYTITSLAEKLGIARESLSRMVVSPSYPTLEKIASALGVPIWQLFASKEEVQGDVCPHCGMPIKIKIEKGE